MLTSSPLGRKQNLADQAGWQQALREARTVWPDSRLNNLIDIAVERVATEVRAGRRTAFAWSGGKDSLALEYVMRQAGVHECVMGMTTDLEYPAMLRWVTANMPDGLTVKTVPLGYDWLRAHPRMLFPQGSHGPRWFQVVQHKVQADYFKAQRLDLLALGRRRRDGNYIGPTGTDRYTNAKGITRWSPIHDWPHEAVLSLILREGWTLPPCYSWPRGFQVGTGAWPARQWTQNTDHGFSEVWHIDPNVIRAAAPHLPAAAEWMRRAEVS